MEVTVTRIPSWLVGDIAIFGDLNCTPFYQWQVDIMQMLFAYNQI